MAVHQSLVKTCNQSRCKRRHEQKVRRAIFALGLKNTLFSSGCAASCISLLWAPCIWAFAFSTLSWNKFSSLFLLIFIHIISCINGNHSPILFNTYVVQLLQPCTISSSWPCDRQQIVSFSVVAWQQQNKTTAQCCVFFMWTFLPHPFNTKALQLSVHCSTYSLYPMCL